MGINNALDALTSPNPSDRSWLVKFVAEICLTRVGRGAPPNEGDVWTVLMVLEHNHSISNTEVKKYSRSTLGGIVADILDAWQLLRSNG